MAADKQSKPEKKPKPADAKPQKAAKPKAPKAEKAAEPAEPAAPKVEAPRPPADPRLKVLKKFRGRFLPKGPLRERLKELEARWTSGDDHGGVTVEELRSLLTDWRASREKKPRKAAQA
jgi:hypothetical protein